MHMPIIEKICLTGMAPPWLMHMQKSQDNSLTHVPWEIKTPNHISKFRRNSNQSECNPPPPPPPPQDINVGYGAVVPVPAQKSIFESEVSGGLNLQSE